MKKYYKEINVWIDEQYIGNLVFHKVFYEYIKFMSKGEIENLIIKTYPQCKNKQITYKIV